MSQNANSEISLLSDIQYYSAATHGKETAVLGRLDDIPYSESGKTVNGSFEIVKGEKGIGLRLVNKVDGIAEGRQVGSLLVDKLSLGKFVKKIGDYEIYENGEVFYRTMSKEHYDELLKTNKILGTGECTTSPTQAFSESYEGVLVQFKVKRGTIERLEEIGIAARNHKDVLLKHPNLKPDISPWNTQFARFKLEKGQVNIALGQGEALKIFNESVIEFKFIKDFTK